MSAPFEDIRALIYRASLTLDREDWIGFLALCAADFRYLITAYSPELRKRMIWFDHDLESLKALLDMVPQHLRRHGTLLRHVSVGMIEPAGSPDCYTVTSTFQCLHTELDGTTRLYAVGRYIDTVTMSDGRVLFLGRDTQLETRDLGIGSHVPL